MEFFQPSLVTALPRFIRETEMSVRADSIQNRHCRSNRATYSRPSYFSSLGSSKTRQAPG